MSPRAPEGFAFAVRADVDGADVDDVDDQQVMARWTGNYRHGNERQARQHPRNRGR